MNWIKLDSMLTKQHSDHNLAFCESFLSAWNVLICWHKLSSVVYISIFARNDEIGIMIPIPVSCVWSVWWTVVAVTSLSLPFSLPMSKPFLCNHLSLHCAVTVLPGELTPPPAPGGLWLSHANHHIWPPPRWLTQMSAYNLTRSNPNKIQESFLENWDRDKDPQVSSLSASTADFELDSP